MNKLILGAAIFSLSMLANAQNASATVTASAAEPEKTVEAAEIEDIQIHSGVTIIKDGKTGCIRETGTRIKSRVNKARDKNGYNGLAGRSYDKDDLDRTGAMTTGEALERLDPSIRISR